VLPPAFGQVLVVPDQGHFVLWKRPGLIVDQILATLARSVPTVAP
jgi:pimeloyl-ACP methyl ester carboxylesterase